MPFLARETMQFVSPCAAKAHFADVQRRCVLQAACARAGPDSWLPEQAVQNMCTATLRSGAPEKGTLGALVPQFQALAQNVGGAGKKRKRSLAPRAAEDLELDVMAAEFSSSQQIAAPRPAPTELHAGLTLPQLRASCCPMACTCSAACRSESPSHVRLVVCNAFCACTPVLMSAGQRETGQRETGWMVRHLTKHGGSRVLSPLKSARTTGPLVKHPRTSLVLQESWHGPGSPGHVAIAALQLVPSHAVTVCTA